jgi:hypothetical protein
MNAMNRIYPKKKTMPRIGYILRKKNNPEIWLTIPVNWIY